MLNMYCAKIFDMTVFVHIPGTVTMWCPKMKEAVVKMLCHKSGVRSIAIDKQGQ